MRWCRSVNSLLVLIMAITTTASSFHVISRIAAGLVGGYVFTWGFIALCLSGFYGLGMSFHDAEALSSILGFLLYLTVFLWAFSASSLQRIWLILVVGGGVMTGAGALIQHSLV